MADAGVFKDPRTNVWDDEPKAQMEVVNVWDDEPKAQMELVRIFLEKMGLGHASSMYAAAHTHTLRHTHTY